MKPVEQTQTGKWGNCMSACVASILELDISEVPNPKKEKEEWLDAWVCWLRDKGFSLVLLDKEDSGNCGWDIAPNTYWIGIVESINYKNKLHAVVMQGGVLAHDPAKGKKRKVGSSWNDIGVTDLWLII